MLKLTAVLATPDITTDEDVVYELDLAGKRELHRVESAMVAALGELVKLTEDELATGKKPFDAANPTTVTFTVNIVKDGAIDYGGYTFRWPNQSTTAQAYLKGMFDGIFRNTGHGGERKLRGKGAGHGRGHG